MLSVAIHKKQIIFERRIITQGNYIHSLLHWYWTVIIEINDEDHILGAEYEMYLHNSSHFGLLRVNISMYDSTSLRRHSYQSS